MALELEIALIGLGGAVIGGLLTSLTTWMISRAERTKFARERTWDLRREAYTQIIGSIVPANRIAEQMAAEYSEDPHTYDASTRMRQAASRYVKHFHAAQDAYHANRLILSAAFAERFERLISDLSALNYHSNLTPPELADETTEILEKATTSLLEIGVSEVALA